MTTDPVAGRADYFADAPDAGGGAGGGAFGGGAEVAGDLVDAADDGAGAVGDDATEAICEVVITAADPEWLAGFTRRLVTDRLAACGQQITAIRSIYRWDGEIQDDPEARVALHTRAGLVDRIIERAEAEHPYDVPCVLALPILAANPAYADWVRRETLP